jgi:prolyl-tRNA synthetase
MRGREFLMKDGYNFDLTKEAALHAYNRHMVSYLRTYERMGLTAIPMRAASGPIGGDDTHEFLVLASTGESEVFYDDAVTGLKLGARAIDYDDRAAVQAVCDEFTALYARTDETHDAAAFEAVPEARRRVGRGIEVGQIFYFGTKYSEPMGAVVTTPEGARVPVHMGSHGIGVSSPRGRADRGQPRRQGHHLARGRDALPRGHRQPQAGRRRGRRGLRGALQGAGGAGTRAALRRPRRAGGAKFATMDLIGLPWRITVGPRGLANGVVELASRRTGESEEMSPEAAVAKLAEIYAPA